MRTHRLPRLVPISWFCLNFSSPVIRLKTLCSNQLFSAPFTQPSKPWRVIAFFPAAIEDELLRKERAYGKRFGRESEEEIAAWRKR